MIELIMPLNTIPVNSDKPTGKSPSQRMTFGQLDVAPKVHKSVNSKSTNTVSTNTVSTKINEAYGQLLNDPKYGFLKVLEDDFDWAELEKFKSSFNNYKQVAIVGIGGSSQGIKSLLKFVSPEAMNSDFIFFDRIDESYIHSQLNKLSDLSEVLWFII
jgi:glucose-6-phosphate isomerase